MGGRAGASPATRRAMLGSAVHCSSAVAAAALLPRLPASLAAESRCASDRPPGQRDRCDVGELMASDHVPVRLREALQLSLRVVRHCGAPTFGTWLGLGLGFRLRSANPRQADQPALCHPLTRVGPTAAHPPRHRPTASTS